MLLVASYLLESGGMQQNNAFISKNKVLRNLQTFLHFIRTLKMSCRHKQHNLKLPDRVNIKCNNRKKSSFHSFFCMMDY